MEPNDGASTIARAQELRASLGARREVEVLLAEATAARQAATADADALVEEAQQLSEELLLESRAEADRLTADARQLAESILTEARAEAEDVTRQARVAADEVRARAEADVEEHRRRVRAEVTEQVTRELAEQSRRELASMHERQQSMIGDLEASVRILGVSLESSVSNIGEMLSALDGLRAHTAESLGDSGIAIGSPPRHAEAPAAAAPAVTEPAPAETEPATAETAETDTAEPAAREPVSPRAPSPAPGPVDDLFRVTADREQDVRPGGGARVSSIFDNPGPTASVPTPSPVFDAGEDGLPDDVDVAGLEDAGEPPLTATEVFLRSSHIDHGDPPLPPLDDADVGARYARDAMRATARARTRQDEETLEVVPERSGPERQGRDERDHRDAAADAADGADHDETDTAGKPLGWLFRSSS